MNIRIVRSKQVHPPKRILIVRERKTGGLFVERKEIKPEIMAKVLHFDGSIPIESDDAKKFDVIKDGDKTVDYQNVRIKGYLSTFQSTTPSDRDGDYVLPGAFKEAIPGFMAKNPVLLRDHRGSTDSIAGRFTTMREDGKGLYIEADLSNSPGNIDTRFKVAEGSLKTLSMGGLFVYGSDGRAIEKVHLWEGSLVALPANPDCLISVRALTEDEMQKCAHEFERAA